MRERKKQHEPDPRHSVIKGLLDHYWQRENPSIPSMPWGPADAGALAQFLRANPSLSPDTVATCLENRLCSEDHAAAERIHRWIGDVLRYASGPLNRFKRPLLQEFSEASVGTYRPDKVWGEPKSTQTIRQFMGKEWFERALRHQQEGKKLTDIERDCLRQEGLL